MGIEEGTCWDEQQVLYGNQFDNTFHIKKKKKIVYFFYHLFIKKNPLLSINVSSHYSHIALVGKEMRLG